jgi:hypothetical protein
MEALCTRTSIFFLEGTGGVVLVAPVAARLVWSSHGSSQGCPTGGSVLERDLHTIYVSVNQCHAVLPRLGHCRAYIGHMRTKVTCTQRSHVHKGHMRTKVACAQRSQAHEDHRHAKKHTLALLALGELGAH